LSILRGHTEGVSRVAFSPDSSRLVTAGLDKIVRVWDMAGRELFSLRGHTALVSDAAFSPDGNRLASGSSDDTVKIWNARTGQELLTLRSPSNASGVLAFSPDGKRLASAGADGWVQVFAMDLDDLTALARERLTRSFTAEECKRYFSNLPCPEGR
jgi:WD40 repeat protein